jgi:hypothetical protein
MTISISGETRARIERMAKMSGRTPGQVVDDTFRLSEEALLAHMPPERHSGYMAGVLEYAGVTTPPPSSPSAHRVSQGSQAYRAMDDDYGSDTFVL